MMSQTKPGLRISPISAHMRVGLYLAEVLDLHSRAVVGWSMGSHMRTSLVLDCTDDGGVAQTT